MVSEQTKVEKLKAAIEILLSVLPDTTLFDDEDETWEHAWDELSQKAQERVCEARKTAIFIINDGEED